MTEVPQSPQLSLSLSDDCASTRSLGLLSSSETVGIGGLVRRLESASVDTSLVRTTRPLLRKVACSKCRRVVERIDEEFEQCVNCNAEEIHEAGRLTLLESLPPERARRFAVSEAELQFLSEAIEHHVNAEVTCLEHR